MNKIVNKILLSSLVLVSSTFASNELSTKQLQELEKLEILKRSQISVTKGIDADSLYILNIKAKNNMVDTIYLTKDKKYLISGDVLDVNNGNVLDMPIDMNILKLKEAFTFGNGKDEYVLFTDPECPYCKKFESYFKQIEDKVKIKVFFYPLDFHKNAYDLSLYIMSQKTTQEKIDTMLKLTLEDEGFKNSKIPDDLKTQLENKLNEQIKIAQSIGVQGTPAMFDKDGNKVVWVKLLQDLGITVK